MAKLTLPKDDFLKLFDDLSSTLLEKGKNKAGVTLQQLLTQHGITLQLPQALQARLGPILSTPVDSINAAGVPGCAGCAACATCAFCAEVNFGAGGVGVAGVVGVA